jgi:asparagine synthase (glutamine-hydrolysing)
VCGIVAVAAAHEAQTVAERGIRTLHHRGPDAAGVWTEAVQGVALGHARLSIVDLSDAGRQPMVSADGRYVLTFNGEIYNYVELREELADYPFRSRTDSEVLLAAWCRWGERALDRLVGMFAFVVWDTVERRLVAVRDRFGVKPLYIAELPSGGVALASEIKALHVMGVPIVDDETTWATFLCTGLTDFSIRTFWRDIRAVEAGTYVEWSADRGTRTTRWYDLAARVGPDLDRRSEADVKAEYRALLESSVRLRFRSDVPVAINLSGGVDSSVLLGLVHAVQGPDSDVNVFTFATGDPQYDEVPELAAKIADVEDEPYGGLPTLAYSKIFAEARARGVIVLLDGNGLDEQWAGYDYYVNAVVGARDAGIVQGTTTSPPVLSDVISPDLRARSIAFTAPERFPDRLRNLQLRDALATKIPRRRSCASHFSIIACSSSLFDSRRNGSYAAEPRSISCVSSQAISFQMVCASRLNARSKRRSASGYEVLSVRGPTRLSTSDCVREQGGSMLEQLERRGRRIRMARVTTATGCGSGSR